MISYDNEISKYKNTIRKQIFQIRKTLSKDWVEFSSSVIINQVVSLPQFVSSANIMSYISFNNEVSTKSVFNKIKLKDKTISVPILSISPDKYFIEVAQLLNIPPTLCSGKYGIQEPTPNSYKIIEPYTLDLIIVPGIAFDTNKNRIGYGKGYYDNFLKKIRPDCLKIGIAFDSQVYKNIKYHTNDIRMDMIITESTIIT